MAPHTVDSDGPLPTASAFPIKTKQTAARIGDGVETSLVYTEFANRLFLTITQYGKIGTLMEADLDTTATFQPSQSTPSVSVRTLLGPAQNPLYQVYASHILQQIHAARNAEKRPLLLSIALKRSVGGDGQKDEEDGFALSEDDRKTFVEVMQLCRDVRVW